MSDPRATGSTRYAEDFELAGMLHARIVRSLFPHARIVRVDASAVPEDCVVLSNENVSFGHRGIIAIFFLRSENSQEGIARVPKIRYNMEI